MQNKTNSALLILLFVLALAGCTRKEKTPDPVSILQLQEMSEMVTTEYVVSKMVKASDSPGWYKRGDRKTLISVKARIKAGIDMQQINESSLEISGNTLSLTLPPAHIISLNIDPASIRQEYERRGYFRSPFSNEERYILLQQAEEDIRAGIAEMGILQTAEMNAVLFFSTWFRLMGYEHVHIYTPGMSAKDFPEVTPL